MPTDILAPMRTTCSKCGEPLDGSHRSYCRACHAAYARENRARRGNQAREYSREYRRQWMADHPDKRGEYARKALYNLKRDEFDLLLSMQDGRCAIWSVVMSFGRGGDCLSVDHDHDTGEVRGLLCQRCNLLVGRLEEYGEEFLSAAVAYLHGSVVEQVDTATLNIARASGEGSIPSTPTEIGKEGD